MHQNKKKASPPKNWRGKGNVREADKARPVFNARMKAVGWGCLIAVAVGGILLCLLSILMAGGKVPIWAIKGIGLAVGCVMAAVSPAVIVPRMLLLKDLGYGADKGVPDMLMTGASADDVFVIVLFTSF